MRRPSQPDLMMTRVAFELPRTQETGEILGFVLGDGSIDQKRKRLSFSNSNPFCIRKMVENFEKTFKIGREGFSYYVTAPFNADLKAVAMEWEKELGLPGRVRVYRDNRKKTKKALGTLSVWVSDERVVKGVCSGIFNLTVGAEKDPEIIVGFLRGFFAAEGAVIPGKVRKEVPNAIQFPQKGKMIPTLIKEFLRMVGIDGRVVLKQKRADYYCVNITAKENFSKFLEAGLSDLHPEKRRKIQTGLRSYVKQQVQRQMTSIRLLSLLTSGPLNRHQIYRKMDRTKQHVNEMLYSRKKSFLLKKGYMVKTAQENVVEWAITPAGRAFLQEQG